MADSLYTAVDMWGLVRFVAPNYARLSPFSFSSPAALLAASNLASQDELRWLAGNVSDQLDLLTVTLLDEPEPRVDSLILHGHNLTAGAQILLRGFPTSETPASYDDMVVLPASESARGAGVSGIFSNVDNGVDAWTPTGITIPGGQFYEVSFAAPAAAPLETTNAGLVRLRCELTDPLPQDVDLVLEIRQPQAVVVLTTTLTVSLDDLAATEAGGIVMWSFNPADIPDAGAGIWVRVKVPAGPTVVLREVDVVWERPVPAGVYRSGWMAVARREPWPFADELAALRAPGPSNFGHYLTAAEAATVRNVWQIRIRDGLHPGRHLSARSILLGHHLGDATDMLLAGEVQLTVTNPVELATIRDAGDLVAIAMGPPRTSARVPVVADLERGLYELFEGLASWRHPFGLVLWPGNDLAEDALTLVVRLAEERSSHTVELGDPELLRTSLSVIEV